jgi:hypothetical protein
MDYMKDEFTITLQFSEEVTVIFEMTVTFDYLFNVRYLIRRGVKSFPNFSFM